MIFLRPWLLDERSDCFRLSEEIYHEAVGTTFDVVEVIREYTADFINVLVYPCTLNGEPLTEKPIWAWTEFRREDAAEWVLLKVCERADPAKWRAVVLDDDVVYRNERSGLRIP
jgi:hypothetical protein